jgi:hypothetical protein
MSATEAPENAPFIDYENLPAPRVGILVTQFITVRSVARSRAFYSEVLGGTALGLGVACHLGVSVAAHVQVPSFSDRVVALALEEPADLTIVSLWAAGTSTPQVRAWRALLTEIDATNVCPKPGLKLVA